MPEGDIYQRIVEAVNANFGSHPQRRAIHAKGSWARGTFTATPQAARLSRAAHLRGEPIEALVRLSNASGKPDANDADRDGRGFAVKLRWEGGETDLLATTSPAFLTRTPEDFLELLEARRPDPQTGAPDMDKLGAYLSAHPEAQTAVQATLMKEPLASFATAPYFSPHAFGLVGGDGTRTWVRWSWLPEAGEERIPDDEARELGRDYLHEEIARRLSGGPVAFELRFQLAAGEDSLIDPTEVWPAARETVGGGRLEIAEPVADPERDGHIDVFDPTRVVDGVELSDDPILHARPKAYSVSAYKRLD